MATFDPTGDNPFDLFHQWMNDAKQANPDNYDAMALATVGADGRPSNRMILLKDYGPQGFTFYTNSGSRKGSQLTENQHVALCLYWRELKRQIRVEGQITIVPRDMTEAYFHSRRRGSQIASYASDQSRPLQNKQEYMDRIASLEKEFEGMDNIPCPDFWNGYQVTPSYIEFWVEGEYRTHDRFVFTQNVQGEWQTERLYP